MEPKTSEYAEDQKRVDKGLLADAIAMKLLDEGSSTEQLTNQVRQNMSDSYMLRDAIDKGILPPGSTLDDLTNSARQELIDANKKENPTQSPVYTSMGKKAIGPLVSIPIR